MSLLKKLEEKLENIFEKAFTRALRKKIEPLELASELERKIEETAVTDVKVPYAANAYTILVSRSDYLLLKPYLQEIQLELEDFVNRKADEIGVVLLGKSEVRFKIDSSIKPGETKIVPQVKKDEFGGKADSVSLEGTKIIPVVEAREFGLQAPEAVLEDLATGKRYHVFRFPFRIGRMEANDAVLDDPTVSRFHAEINKEGRHYYIRDLGSTNGTFVNGKEIRVKKLNANDIISCGNSRLRWIPAE
jgi:hypothetical protein